MTPSAGPGSSLRGERVVTFSDDPEPYLSHETVARVTRAIENAQMLEKKWSLEAKRLEASKEFVQKVRGDSAPFKTLDPRKADISVPVT